MTEFSAHPRALKAVHWERLKSHLNHIFERDDGAWYPMPGLPGQDAYHGSLFVWRGGCYETQKPLSRTVGRLLRPRAHDLVRVQLYGVNRQREGVMFEWAQVDVLKALDFANNNGTLKPGTSRVYCQNKGNGWVGGFVEDMNELRLPINSFLRGNVDLNGKH